MSTPLCWSPPTGLRTASCEVALPPGGAELTVRLLDPTDAGFLDSFLRDGLSTMSKQRFGAHRLDRQSAVDACMAIGQDQTLRVVAIAHGPQSDELVGYLMLHAVIPLDEQMRYAGYGHGEIVNGAAMRLAPAVADRFHGRGIGTLLIRYAVSLARRVGVRTVILWGGTHDDNAAGRRLYERTGFRYEGTFETDRPALKADGPMLNHDMALDVDAAIAQDPALRDLCQVTSLPTFHVPEFASSRRLAVDPS